MKNVLDFLRVCRAVGGKTRRGLRAVLLSFAVALATPAGQAMLIAALGKYSWAAPMVMAVFGMIVKPEPPDVEDPDS